MTRTSASSSAGPSQTFSRNQITLGFSGLSQADDRDIWAYAKAYGFTIVSQDVDFADMAALLGSPPKVIWLRVGNQSTAVVSNLLRRHAELIATFESDNDAVCLQLY